MAPASIRCLPLRRPTILSVRGPDAVRFLNGQLTQDASGLDDEARWSCITDAKGRLQFFVSIFQAGEQDEIWIAARPGVADELHDRLDRYLIADEVEMEDLSDRFVQVHAESELNGAHCRRKIRSPFGTGWDHWFAADSPPEIETLTIEQEESLRIQAGLPTWGAELAEGMLPPEAGLDAFAVSYRKGCYIGQEVLSRIKSIGRVNRRLARFTVTTATPDELLIDDTPVGSLTSIDPVAEGAGERPALGYVGKKGYEHKTFALPDGSCARWLGWA